MPDWDAEMTLFKKRITKPNQLSTLRRMLAQADTGKVLYCADSLAIVEGLVNDAPVGTELVFANGAKGYVCMGWDLDTWGVSWCLHMLCLLRVAY